LATAATMLLFLTGSCFRIALSEESSFEAQHILDNSGTLPKGMDVVVDQKLELNTTQEDEEDLTRHLRGGCGVRFKATKDVVKHLRKTSMDANYCSDRIEPVAKGLGVAAKVTTSFSSKYAFIVDNTENITKDLRQYATQLRKRAKLVRSVPKVGPILASGARILDGVAQTLERVHSDAKKFKPALKLMSKVVTYMTKTVAYIQKSYDTLGTSSKAAAILDKQTMLCAKRSDSCSDDNNLEQKNSHVLPATENTYEATKICKDVFKTMDKIIDAIIQALAEQVIEAVEDAIDALEKVLKPLMDFYEKVAKAVDRFINESKCCVVPYASQVIERTSTSLFDLIGCVETGVEKKVEEKINELLDKMQQELFAAVVDALEPVFDLMRKTDIELPVLEMTASPSETCELDVFKITTETVNPFEELLAYPWPEKPEPFSFEPEDVWDSIQETCEDAFNSLLNPDVHDCCTDFVEPLDDGELCDPLNSWPYMRCMMCKSGTYGVWLSKGGLTACGKEDLDTKCAEELIYNVAKCGDNLVKDKDMCGTKLVTDVASCGKELYKCGKEWVTDAALCGTQYFVSDGAQCGYEFKESLEHCGQESYECWKYVTSGLKCGWRILENPGCIFRGDCEKVAKRCKVKGTCTRTGSCNVPKSCTKAKSCLVDKFCEKPKSCHIANSCCKWKPEYCP